MSDEKIIRVEHLKKHYKGGSIKALDDISLEITKGEVVENFFVKRDVFSP